MNRLTAILLFLFLSAAVNLFAKIDDSTSVILSKMDEKEKVDYLNTKAETFSETNSKEKINYAAKALEIAEAQSYSNGIARALFNLGTAYFNLKDRYEAVSNFKRALNVYGKLDERNRIAEVNFKLGAVYKELFDYKKALLFLEEAKKHYEYKNDKRNLALSLKLMGEVNLLSGSFENTGKYYTEALNIFDSLSDVKESAKCSEGLADLYFAWGNNSKSISYYQEALSKNERINAQIEIVDVSNKIGIVYKDIHKIEVAANYFQKANNLSRQLKYKTGEANSLLSLGGINTLNRNFDVALKNYETALEIYEEILDNEGISRTLLGLAGLYEESDKNYKALQIYKRALSLNELLNNIHSEALILFHIADIYSKTNSVEYSIEFYKKSIQLAAEANLNNILQKNYLGIAKSHEKLGNFEEALKYQILYSELSDSIFAVKSMSSIAETQSSLEVIKSKKEIEELVQDRLVQQLELESQNQQRNFLFFITIIIFLLASIIYYRYHLKIRLNREVTEQKNKVELLNKELNRKNAYLIESESKLKYLNATKDKFFSIISHDLKNPFSTLMGYTDLLIEFYNDFSEDEKKSIMQEIQNSTYKTYNLLENLLLWSKSQRGELKMLPEKLDVAMVFAENITLLCDTAKKKNLCFTSEVKQGTYALADYNTLTTVVKNLLTNSIKFTSSGGEVIISAIEKDNKIEITVSDNGVAISKEDIGKLFRIDVHHTSIGVTAEKSTGLGLILCKEFVEKNGGSIWVESEMGKGSEFKFTVPKYIG